MVPKVDFQIHEVFIEAFFFPKLWGGNRDKLNEVINNFTDSFRANEEKILNLIQKYSGFEWSKEKIPVFLVPDNAMLLYSYQKYSLQEGLPGIVQKIRVSGKFRDFFIFIHELSHVNQTQSDFYSVKYGTIDKDGVRNTDRLELSADLVTLYVLRELFGLDSDYEKDFWDFLQNTNEKNKRKLAEIQKYEPSWDLNKQPLKTYLEL